MASQTILKNSLGLFLYESYAKELPIIDYHNHLAVQDVLSDRKFENITQLWITTDPYKHRAMRILGVPEHYITGNATDFEKFEKWYGCLPRLAGNPLYDWDKMKQTGYAWWIRRMAAAGKLYDVIRIDHFRGFESYWAIPAGEETAINGRWVLGPGMDFINAIKKALPDLDFIAEDLGYVTPEVRQLQLSSGYPGMKVMEFAFDSREEANYLPHLYPVESVCYTGTHDNVTMKQWFDEALPEDIAYAKAYLGLNEEEGFIRGMIRGGMSSVSRLFVAQMQDYLELGKEARMNFPGTLSTDNWTWRAEEGFDSPELAADIYRITKLYDRVKK